MEPPVRPRSSKQRTRIQYILAGASPYDAMQHPSSCNKATQDQVTAPRRSPHRNHQAKDQDEEDTSKTRSSAPGYAMHACVRAYRPFAFYIKSKRYSMLYNKEIIYIYLPTTLAPELRFGKLRPRPACPFLELHQIPAASLAFVCHHRQGAPDQSAHPSHSQHVNSSLREPAETLVLNFLRATADG